jgi:hypothetical protein
VKHQKWLEGSTQPKMFRQKMACFAQWAEKTVRVEKILGNTMIACSMACTTIAHFVNCLGYEYKNAFSMES